MVPMQWKMPSVIGPLYLVASSEGLRGVFWEEQAVPMAPSLNGPEKQIQILATAAQQIEEYLAGKRTRFELPLAPEGTDFQQRVWQELMKIPYGKTFSYSDIAHNLKNEKAVRAVGTANGKNPLCLIVPCHRVIAANGSLGGYSGGLEIKKKLLDLERSSMLVSSH